VTSPRLPPRRARALLVLCCASAVGTASAQLAPPDLQKAQEVDVVEQLNAQVPLDAVFTDAEGQPVRLGELLGGERPVVLTLAYYKCPMLCSLVLGGLKKAALGSGLQLGRDYTAITLSIDPRETPALAKEGQRQHLQSINAPGQEKDWSFLVGEDAQIRRLAEAVGFGYHFDESTGQYAHPAAVLVLTPDGRVSRYLYGVEFPPRDLRFAALEAGGGRVGTSFDRVILKCFRFDSNSKRYEFYVFGFIRTGGLLVFVALTAMLAAFWRREYKRGSIR
jgi:protein SCO1/2